MVGAENESPAASVFTWIIDDIALELVRSLRNGQDTLEDGLFVEGSMTYPAMQPHVVHPVTQIQFRWRSLNLHP